MPRMELSQADVQQIQTLLAELAERYDTAECQEFQKNATVLSHRLPESVRTFLTQFRLTEPDDGCCIISGYPFDQGKIGPTPAHWKNRADKPSTREEDMLFVLLGSLLGDCIGWSTQQSGYIVHDIMPIKGNEGEQLGTGSEELLWWHTEDAFHPYRGDYIGMMCIRNPDHVPTTIGTLEDVDLDPNDVDLLFEESYSIKPDESHLKKNRSGLRQGDRALEDAFNRMEERNTNPPKMAVLFGSKTNPYLRLDPYFMDKATTEEAQGAFDRLVEKLDDAIREVPLQDGDFCFVDNLKAIHGRLPFKARYDGTDRWLKRIIIARDLRKSRDERMETESRLIL